MKIAVVCANGKAGKAIVKEAIARNLAVKAIMRSEVASEASEIIIKDLYQVTYDDIADCDVVVDAFGAWMPETLCEHSKSLRYLCDVLKNKSQRLIIVGGAGSLYLNKEHTLMLSDSEDFPEIFKPLASAMTDALKELRTRNDVKWTYISPAADFQADGQKTGKYIIAGEELTLNSKNESIISYADYAIALVDEILSGKNYNKRISVVRQ